jgi:hypothetical protein
MGRVGGWVVVRLCCRAVGLLGGQAVKYGTGGVLKSVELCTVAMRKDLSISTSASAGRGLLGLGFFGL